LPPDSVSSHGLAIVLAATPTLAVGAAATPSAETS